MSANTTIQPSSGAVLLEQFRLVGLRARWGLAAYAASLLLFALIVLADGTGEGGVILLPNDLSNFLLFLLFLPAIAWAPTAPSLNGYLRAMPVGRRRHTASGVVVVWMWVMIGVATTLAFFALLALLTDGRIGGMQPGLSYSSGGYARFMEVSEAVAERFGSVRHTLPAWQWLTPFAAISVVSLLIAAILLGFGTGGLMIAFFGYLLAAAAARASGSIFGAALAAIVDGRLGLATLFSGNTRRDLEVLHLPGGDALVRAVEPDLSAWLGALALWGVLATGALVIAVARRGDL